MEIDGNLVIRWHDRGPFEVSLVPAGSPPPAPVPVRRLADADALEQLLTDLGVEGERIGRILRSPYVLQSQRVRVERRIAARLGLIPTTPLRQALDFLAQVATHPARLMRRGPRRSPPGA